MQTQATSTRMIAYSTIDWPRRALRLRTFMAFPCWALAYAHYIYKRWSGRDDSSLASDLTFRAGAALAGYATAGRARLSISTVGVTWGIRAKAAQIRIGATPATATTMRASSIWFIGAASNRKQPMLSTRPIPRH